MSARTRITSITAAAALGAIVLLPLPAFAGVAAIDPDKAIDADLVQPGAAVPAPSAPAVAVAASGVAASPPVYASAAPVAASDSVAVAQSSETYKQDDLIGAAEGVFGKGAHGLASLIEDLLKKQGEPNGYIVGREGGGALVFGVRYGSGTLHHKVEGEMPVYWTGPSVGFDAGANAGNAFVLVYNLHDTAELYKRFGSGEGQAYFIGGFNVSYLRQKNVVLIPVRMGAGLRLGANLGYMKFSQKQRWVPF